jgi:hypothetical protein
VKRRLGRGAIWFTAFDPTLAPLDSWDGSLPLWRRILRNDRQPILGAAATSAVDDPWMKALLGNPPLTFPRSIIALAFAGCYMVLLAPFLSTRFSRRLGSRLRAMLLLSVAAAACCAGWLIFNRELFRSGARLLDAARVDVVPGDGMARVTEKIGIFAAQAGSAELFLGSADVAVDEAIHFGASPRSGSTPRPGFTVDTSHDTILRGISYGAFGSRLVVLTAVIPMPLEAVVRGTDNSLNVSVYNGSARPLRRCFLLHAGRGYPVGDVAPLQTVTRSFAPVDGLSLTDPASRAQMAGDPRRAAFWDQSEAEPGKGSSSVIGWMDGPVIARVPADRPALSLVVVEAK